MFSDPNMKDILDVINYRISDYKEKKIFYQ